MAITQGLIDVYAKVFSLLADSPTPKHREWAIRLWEDMARHDIPPSALGIDRALVVLKLARVEAKTAKMTYRVPGTIE